MRKAILGAGGRRQREGGERKREREKGGVKEGERGGGRERGGERGSHKKTLLSEREDDMVGWMQSFGSDACFSVLMLNGSYIDHFYPVCGLFLQGPYEVGSMLLGIEGVVQIMFTLASSDNMHYQVGIVETVSCVGKLC